MSNVASISKTIRNKKKTSSSRRQRRKDDRKLVKLSIKSNGLSKEDIWTLKNI